MFGVLPVVFTPSELPGSLSGKCYDHTWPASVIAGFPELL